jgi:hypothetical protein
VTNSELIATHLFISNFLSCFCLFITVELCLCRQLPFDKETNVFTLPPPVYNHASYWREGRVDGLLQLSDIQIQDVDSGMQTILLD